MITCFSDMIIQNTTNFGLYLDVFISFRQYLALSTLQHLLFDFWQHWLAMQCEVVHSLFLNY